MKRSIRLLMTVSAIGLALLAGVAARPLVAQEYNRSAVRWTQRDESGERWSPGRLWGRWWRGSSENQKNNTRVKSIYARAAKAIGKSTVRILVDGKSVALGTVVEADGYIVTKASLLDGADKITCRLDADDDVAAELVGVNENYDLALLKVEGQTLQVPPPRDEAATAGTFVAAMDAEGEVIGVGVVSIEPRSVRAVRRPNLRRGWLGVSLGGGDSGAGITSVMDNSAAQRAGLKEEDRVKSIDGVEMTSMQQIIDTIGSHSPGDTVTLLVDRRGKEVTLSATLGKPVVGTDPQDQWGGGPFSVRRDGFPEVLMHDAAVLPSQCGGPLIDIDGKVVGVNIARALRVSTYAVPWDKIVRLAEELKKSG